MMTFLKKKVIIILLFIAVSMVSCRKWFDILPPSNVKEEVLFSTQSGYEEAINGVYVQMQQGLYDSNLTMSFLSVLSQNYDIPSDHSLYQEVGYNYTNQSLRPKIDAIWGNFYKTIANINNILKNVDNDQAIFNENGFEITKGTALGLRAFLHFDLLRLFGSAPIAANYSTLSIPYVKTYGNQVTATSNLMDVINACLQDLDQAEQLLSIDSVTNQGGRIIGRNRFNYWSVIALKSRIYLYIGNKPKALEYAKKLIESKYFSFTPPSEVSRDVLLTREHIFALSVPNLKAKANSLFNIANNNSGSSDFAERTLLYISQEGMNDIYEVSTVGSTDYRVLYMFNTVNQKCYSKKFLGDGQFSNQMPLLRLSEIYYIAAECEPNLMNALGYLNIILKERGLNTINEQLIKSKEALQAEITKEYQKEFYAEGQLFFYYKRLGFVQIPRSNVTTSLATYVLPIPLDEIEFGNRG